MCWTVSYNSEFVYFSQKNDRIYFDGIFSKYLLSSKEETVENDLIVIELRSDPKGSRYLKAGLSHLFTIHKSLGEIERVRRLSTV